MHPVIKRLLTKKTGLYGQSNFIFNLLINFIFTALWTALTVTLPPYTFGGSNDTNTTNTNETDILLRVDFYMPYNKQSWRIVLELVGLLLAVYFCIQVFKNYTITHLYKHTHIHIQSYTNISY